MVARTRMSLILFKHTCALCLFLCILLCGAATVLAAVLDDDAVRGRQLFLTGQAREPGLRALVGPFAGLNEHPDPFQRPGNERSRSCGLR